TVRGHERVSQPAGTAKRLAAACFQALVDVAFRRLPGGNQPQSHARDQRQQESRREDGPVNTYGLLPRQVGRPQEKEQVNAFDGNEETGYASDQGDQKILGQKLAHDAPAAGAQGAANGQFVRARSRAREDEVGDVGASDEEHETYRPEQGQEG